MNFTTLDSKKKSQSNFKVLSSVKFKKKDSLVFRIVLVCIVTIFGLNITSAQDNYKTFNTSGHIKNMHTWHGSVVHPGAVFTTSLEFKTRNKKFIMGIWGGASFTSTDIFNENTSAYVNANYKEVSLYASYYFNNNFYIEAVSHNNYTGIEERGDVLHYWSYDKTQGYNFVDIGFGYTIIPEIQLYLATIIGGGSGDYEVQYNGALEDSWTHYFEINSKVWKHINSSLSLFAGGAWSFISDKTFYTQDAGNVINVGATFCKDIMIANYKLPVEVTAMWNPEKEITVLQLDIALF